MREDVSKEMVASLYKSGFSTPVIARRFNCDPKTIWYRLQQAGVQARRALPIKRGREFGDLVATGRVKGRRAEVVCPHGATKWIFSRSLRIGESTNCQRWGCRFKKGKKFGKLTATGRTQIKRWRSGHQRRMIQVICNHKIWHWVAMSSLESGDTKSCSHWPECGLTRGERSHHQYLRCRTPRVSLQHLIKFQHGVCILCGGTRKGRLSHEHLIPIVRAARWKMSLRRKNEIANHRFNIFAAHRFCNTSRNDLSLEAYWDRNPQFWQGGRRAFSNLMAHHQPRGNKDMKIVKRILREAGMLLGRDRDLIQS